MNTYLKGSRERELQRKVEKLYWGAVKAISALVILGLVVLAIYTMCQPETIAAEPPVTAAPDEYITAAAYIEPAPDPEPEATPEPEPTPAAPRYELTAAERDIIEKTVMAEGGNTEDNRGLILIAQCILNACEASEIRPDEAVRLYKYAPPAEAASQRVKAAVTKVFTFGETVADEPIMFFYAPRYCHSAWHESLVFVAEHGGHRFFTLEVAP